MRYVAAMLQENWTLGADEEFPGNVHRLPEPPCHGTTQRSRFVFTREAQRPHTREHMEWRIERLSSVLAVEDVQRGIH